MTAKQDDYQRDMDSNEIKLNVNLRMNSIDQRYICYSSLQLIRTVSMSVTSGEQQIW